MTIYGNAQINNEANVKMENEGITFITKEQKDKAWEGNKMTELLSVWRADAHQAKVSQDRAIINMTVEGVPSEVG